MNSRPPLEALGGEDDRWRRISEIFEGALELMPEDRPKYLADACGDDSGLRRAVEELLAVGDEAKGFLSGPLLPSMAEVEEAPDHGGRFGSYRVLKQLGKGGMGTVYLAVRDDDTFRRQVAIKVIRRGRESHDTRRRLMVERQILANLDHPHIAKLYDAGTTAEGWPYFVMEYVEGLPIHEHCEHHRLSTSECLELFRKVCAAVHYAHQNLVVHRDIKPSNLLVTPDGEPKLLDFGIAKLLDPEVIGPEHEPTATSQRLLTPHYASPEQLLGEIITTASDVYSLGVLLYRLLTGRLPFEFGKCSHGEIVRLLTQSEPPIPSAAAVEVVRGQRPSEVAQDLRGDLDQVMLKALRFSPHQRYASADRLAEDLERYAQGRPVLARDGELRYRMGKLVRRHWRAFAVAGTILLLLVAFAIQQLVHSKQLEAALELAEVQRREADQEREKAEGALAFIVTLLERVDPTGTGESNLTMLQILATAEAAIQEQFVDQPEIEALLRETLGRIYNNLGQNMEARKQSEKALKLHEDLAGDHRLSIARLQSQLGLVLLEGEEFAKAKDLLTGALEQTEELIGREDPRFLPLLNHLVTYYCYAELYAEAIELSKEAEQLARRPETETAFFEEAINNRAVVARHTGELEEAQKLYEETLAFWSDTEKVHIMVAVLHNNLGVLLAEKGDLARAESEHEHALYLRRKIFDVENFDIVQSLHHLAKIRRQRGNLQGAEVMGRQAFEIYRQLEGAGEYRTLSLATNLADILRELGQLAEAESLLREEISKVGFPGDPHRVTKIKTLAPAKGVLGAVLVARRAFSEAERYLDESLSLAQEIEDTEGQHLALERLITLYEEWGKAHKASASRQRLAALADLPS